jgi:predicted metal-binding membrane protein
MLKELVPSDGQPGGKGNGNLRLSRDRGAWLTSGLLIILAALAWGAVILQATRRPGDMDMTMMTTGGWPSLASAMAYLAAWGVMMAAMMLPSAIPMIALYSVLQRRFAQTGQTGLPTVLFTLVYLAVWLAFGVPIYAASVVVALASQFYPAVAGLLPYALALVLLGAGAYQFSPLMHVCLRACQSPMGFLMGHWRNGYRGTLRLALAHAAYCLVCCGGLMVVLVAAGAMALQWVLLIAALVFSEKILPRGAWTARVIGGALIVLGLLVAARPDLVSVLRGPAM